VPRQAPRLRTEGSRADKSQSGLANPSNLPCCASSVHLKYKADTCPPLQQRVAAGGVLVTAQHVYVTDYSSALGRAPTC
jgi:hypothetical protein